MRSPLPAPCVVVLLSFWIASCGPHASDTVRDLRPETPFEDEIRSGEEHRYALDLDVGQFVHIVVDQRSVDVASTLYSPAGDEIIDVDRAIGYEGPEPLLAVATDAGPHTLVVMTYPGDTPPGRYEIRIDDLHDASEEDRLRARAAALVAGGKRKISKEPEQAREVLGQARKIWEEVGDELWQAETLYLLGRSFKKAGDRKEAAHLFQRSAALFEVAGDPVMQANALNETGVLYRKDGEIEKAITSYTEALSISRTAGKRLQEAISYSNLGQAHRNQGKYDQALALYHQALDLLDDEKDRPNMAKVLHNLGVVYRILGRPELAKDHLIKAEGEFSALGDTRSQATSLNQLGKLFQDLGTPEEAIAYHRQALELRRTRKDSPGEAKTLVDIGLAYQALRETGTALDAFTGALAILRALESSDPSLEAKVLLALGSLHHTLSEESQALEDLEKSLGLFRGLEDPAGEAEALLGISAARADLGDFEAAHDAADQAVGLVEQVRLSAVRPDLRSSYFATVQDFFDHQIELRMRSHREQPDAGYDAAALLASERARSRSLVEMLAEVDADIRVGVARDLLAREKEVQKGLNTSAQRLQRLRMDAQDQLARDEKKENRRRQRDEEKLQRELATELGAVRSEIRAQSPRYAALTQPGPLDLDEIQRQLSDGSLLLEIHLGEERSFLWLVARNSLDVVELPRREVLELLARRTTEQLGKSNRAGSRKISQSLLHDLSEALLGPVADRLAGQRLVIVADAALQYFPFAALPHPKALGEGADAPPLLVEHEIVYAPSASALAVLRRETRRRLPAPGLLAVLADPAYSPQSRQFPPLKHSRAEAEAILSLVPAEHRRSVFGEEASKEDVLAGELGRYRIVHFATHAVLDTEQPDLSGLVLSQVDARGRPVDDAFLRLHEIYNLDLPAELVVLSACETALGKEVRGEGLVGLTRGFMYAGARRVVVSLWNVSDRSTSALMTRFYQGMLEEGLTPAAALRQAQLEMWQKHKNPFYWAAFVLQGEWGPLPSWEEDAKDE